MRALTILQPHAYFIVGDPKELAAIKLHDGSPLGPKRVENRGRYCSYRGELLIHAGVSRNWYTRDWQDLVDADRLVFGAIVGVVELVECASLMDDHEAIRKFWPWVLKHPHTFGPQCLILDKVRRFRNPVPWLGEQGLWNPETCKRGNIDQLRESIKTAAPVEWQP